MSVRKTSQITSKPETDEPVSARINCSCTAPSCRVLTINSYPKYSCADVIERDLGLGEAVGLIDKYPAMVDASPQCQRREAGTLRVEKDTPARTPTSSLKR